MELLNATKMLARYTLGMKPDGREFLVVVIKGTFTIPKSGQLAELAQEQVPLVEADTFTGKPGFSAPIYESDFSPFKAKCDVLLNGRAYAPGGKPTNKVTVGLTVGSINKTFNVVGNRSWKAGILGISPDKSENFDIMAITYDKAFGGLDNRSEDPAKHLAWMPNPIGCGYHNDMSHKLVDRSPMPNTEEVNFPIKRPKGKYRPMSFGPIGRGWEPRYKFAGTYDDEWLENAFPFLPADFNEAYYQSAPSDQQMPYPQGGEEVVLLNLTSHGRTSFRLPIVEVPVVFFRKRQEDIQTKGHLDTIVIEPENGTFCTSWRATIPLKKNIFEVAQVLVGDMPRGWWRARRLGKTYYASLDDLVRKKRIDAMEEA
ncbi:MAG: DUF2169 domain-containing protein, partial [Nitrospirota bacterium]